MSKAKNPANKEGDEFWWPTTIQHSTFDLGHSGEGDYAVVSVGDGQRHIRFSRTIRIHRAVFDVVISGPIASGKTTHAICDDVAASRRHRLCGMRVRYIRPSSEGHTCTGDEILIVRRILYASRPSPTLDHRIVLLLQNGRDQT